MPDDKLDKWHFNNYLLGKGIKKNQPLKLNLLFPETLREDMSVLFQMTILDHRYLPFAIREKTRQFSTKEFISSAC